MRLLREPSDGSGFRAIWTIRKNAGVTRWHTEPTVRHETVATHSYHVAMTLLSIFEEQCSRELLVAALIHDLGERVTGDWPAPVKWALWPGNGSSNTSGAPLDNPLDALERRVLRWMGFKTPDTLSALDGCYLHAADTLDLCFFLLEELRRGNQDARIIMARVRRHLAKHPEILGIDKRFEDVYYDVHLCFKQSEDGHQQVGLLCALEERDFWQSSPPVDLDGVSGDPDEERDEDGRLLHPWKYKSLEHPE